MIIYINKSRIFTQDPAIRFAREYVVPLKSWSEFWRRYKLLDYTDKDLIDFMFAKYGRRLDYKSINRWITKGEIYLIVSPLLKRGVEQVNTNIFGDHEVFVMNELVKPLKYGATTKSESII